MGWQLQSIHFSLLYNPFKLFAFYSTTKFLNMHINELPEAILISIFHFTVNYRRWASSKHYKLNLWKTKIALLSSCKIWRNLALHKVHRTSFFRCSRISRQDSIINDWGVSADLCDYSGYDTYDELSCSDDTNEPLASAFAVKSNLNIIPEYCKCYPKNIHIHVKTLGNPLYNLPKIIEKIRHHRHLLEKVRHLKFSFCIGYNANFRANIPAGITDANYIGKEFAQHITRVIHIKCDHMWDTPVLLGFTQSVFKGYAHQLMGFDYPSVGLGMVEAFQDKLKYAKLHGYTYVSTKLPPINVEGLERLHLEHMNVNVGWDYFKRNDDLRIMHFKELKSLYLSSGFEVDEENNEFITWGHYKHALDYKVVAPKLDSVSIRICPFTLAFLASIHNLKIIENIRLILDRATVWFEGFDMGVAKGVFERHAASNRDGSRIFNFHKFMNDMLGIPDLARRVEVSIDNMDTLFNDKHNIYWEYLHSIELGCAIYIDDIAKLLSKIPNIEEIHFTHLITSRLLGIPRTVKLAAGRAYIGKWPVSSLMPIK